MSSFLGHLEAERKYHVPYTKCTSCILCMSSVPEFLDLGGRRLPVVNNFPLSHVIFKVNFPLSNDPLALVSQNANSSAIILDFL